MNVNQSSRTWAFLAYLLPLLGPLLVLAARRGDRFAAYHATQSLTLTIMLVAIPLGWAVAGWALLWVPLVGGPLAAMLFALVIAAAIALVVAWLLGMVNALRGLRKPVWLFGGWGERTFRRMVAAA